MSSTCHRQMWSWSMNLKSGRLCRSIPRRRVGSRVPLHLYSPVRLVKPLLCWLYTYGIKGCTNDHLNHIKDKQPRPIWPEVFTHQDTPKTTPSCYIATHNAVSPSTQWHDQLPGWVEQHHLPTKYRVMQNTASESHTKATPKWTAHSSLGTPTRVLRCGDWQLLLGYFWLHTILHGWLPRPLQVAKYKGPTRSLNLR